MKLLLRVRRARNCEKPRENAATIKMNFTGAMGYFGGNIGSFNRVASLAVSDQDDGNAAVGTYFHVEEVREPGKTQEQEYDYLESSFRGRLLRGQKVTVPSEFKGVVAAFRPQEDVHAAPQDDDLDAEEIEAVPTSMARQDMIIEDRFSSFTYWNHDLVPSESDITRRGLQWLEMFHSVHDPVTEEDIKKEMVSQASETSLNDSDKDKDDEGPTKKQRRS
eukprot:CAMPEP_0184673514 /NCGR_PEP_ID=MMETSP0308-20130426/86723_1 /TAXON_ID=38269 /ORGANISM="Gloeochaete witrockiana, Strain SAG 46.84" /LENGTH=219 /DNA_ID=CAMNT_0027121011 /DNA_START=1267 /DNA_END=1927 /DNA_ORIENTATION=+